MKSLPGCQLVGYVQRLIKPLGKELNHRSIAYINSVDAIGPINKQPAPYHNGEYGKVNPMKPADSQRMLFNDLFQNGCVTCQINDLNDTT